MLDGQCMLTAVLRRCSSDRLSTAVQDEIPSTTRDLTMSIAAQYIGLYARQACGHAEAALSSGRASHELLTAAYGYGAERLRELSHAMRKIDNGRIWLSAAHARQP